MATAARDGGCLADALAIVSPGIGLGKIAAIRPVPQASAWVFSVQYNQPPPALFARCFRLGVDYALLRDSSSNGSVTWGERDALGLRLIDARHRRPGDPTAKASIARGDAVDGGDELLVPPWKDRAEVQLHNPILLASGDCVGSVGQF